MWSLATSILYLSACGSTVAQPDSLREALLDRGVDIGALFAAPTEAELEAVRRSWTEDAFEPTDVREEWSGNLASGDPVRVISHRVEGRRHYGAIILPEGVHEPSSLPIAAGFSGFGPEMTVELSEDSRAFRGEFVTLLPSFRGQTLRFGTETWVSDGNPYDQCDGGTDDAIAFIEAALSITPEADAERMVALGGSRGGNVALLVGVRDPRVDGVISIAGPTDFFRQPLLDHPNAGVLYATNFVEGLLDESGDLESSRTRMLSCSPVYFADELPPTQIHHGTQDLALPYEQAELLADRIRNLGESAPPFEFYTYPGAGHELTDEQAIIDERIDEFIDQLDYR